MAPGNRKAPQRAASSESTYNLVEFMRDFPNDETCLVWLWDTRFNLGDDQAHCERCGEIRQFRRYTAKQQRQDWTCTACSLHVHPTAGTIFHKSSTSLHLWFYAMYLMTATRCGISAKQLERELGVTYKTAWRMFNLIRNQLMAQDEDLELSGVVEMDETYVGGKIRQSQKNEWTDLTETERRRAAIKWSNDSKAQVFGAVQRKRLQMLAEDSQPTVTQTGKVVAHVIPNKAKAGLMAIINDSVAANATIYTDEAKRYINVRPRHESVTHSKGEFVRGDVSTQAIDGFWALLKNGIRGVHHGVSPEWLQGYVNEYVWRYNHLDDTRGMFAALALRAAFPIG